MQRHALRSFETACHLTTVGSRNQLVANCDCDIRLFLHPDIPKDFADMTASNLYVCST